MGLKHRKGRPLFLGWNQGLEASEPSTPSSPLLLSLRLSVHCLGPLQTSGLCQGTQTPLSNPVFSTVVTTWRNSVAPFQLQ